MCNNDFLDLVLCWNDCRELDRYLTGRSSLISPTALWQFIVKDRGLLLSDGVSSLGVSDLRDPVYRGHDGDVYSADMVTLSQGVFENWETYTARFFRFQIARDVLLFRDYLKSE